MKEPTLKSEVMMREILYEKMKVEESDSGELEEIV